MKFKIPSLNPFARPIRGSVCCLLCCAPGLFLCSCRDPVRKGASGTVTAVSAVRVEKLLIPADMIRAVPKPGEPPVSPEAGEVDVYELLKRDGIERVELIPSSGKDQIDPRWKSVQLKGSPIRFEADLEKLHHSALSPTSLDEQLSALLKTKEHVHDLLSAELRSSEGRMIPALEVGVFSFELKSGG